jgi:hypothetical protein
MSIPRGVVDDTIARNPQWQLVADIACGLSLFVFVFAWWSPSVNRFVGAALPVLLALAIAWAGIRSGTRLPSNQRLDGRE